MAALVMPPTALPTAARAAPLSAEGAAAAAPPAAAAAEGPAPRGQQGAPAAAHPAPPASDSDSDGDFVISRPAPGAHPAPGAAQAPAEAVLPHPPSHTTVHFLHHRPISNPAVPGLVSDPASFAPLIVGSCPELGSWDPAKSSVWMKPLPGRPDVWHASVRLANGDGMRGGRPHEHDWRKAFEEEAVERMEPAKLAAYRKIERQIARLKRKGHDAHDPADEDELPKGVCEECHKILAEYKAKKKLALAAKQASAAKQWPAAKQISTPANGTKPVPAPGNPEDDSSEPSDSSSEDGDLPPDPPPVLPHLPDLFHPADIHSLRHTSRIAYKYVLRAPRADSSPGRLAGSPMRWEDGDNRVAEWRTCGCHFGGNEVENAGGKRKEGKEAEEPEAWLGGTGLLIPAPQRRAAVARENSWATVEWDEEMVRKLLVSEGGAGEGAQGEGGGDLGAEVWIVEEGLGIHRYSRRVVVGRAAGSPARP